MSLINIPEKVELPECANNIITNITEKPTQTIGTIINDILFMASHKLSFHADKIRLQQQLALEQFKKEIEIKIDQIPEANLSEPNIQLIGTAIDDSQYCLEHEELREMFANLIAASLNTTKSSKATPLLWFIIIRLNPFDTLILSTFSNCGTRPICQYNATNDTDSVTMQTNVYLEGISQANIYDIEKRAIAISVLEALGLVKINYLDHLTSKGLYEPFSLIKAYNDYAIRAKKIGVDRKIDVNKGYVELTPTGKQFMDICMPGQT